MTHWSSADRRPARSASPTRQGAPREGYSLRVVPGGEFERRPPRGRYYEEREPDEPEEARSSSAALIILILILGAAFAYLVTRPGALDGLLPALASQQNPPEAAQGPAEVSEVAAPQPQQVASVEPVARPPMPDMAGLAIMIRNSIAALGQANATGNYSVFREIAAPRFQEANTAARLSEVFAALRARNLDLGLVMVANPRLHRDPIIDDQGMLRLAGFFPATSGQIDFELVFQMADARWRLFGIGVQPTDTAEVKFAPADKSALPEPAAMVVLIRSTIAALNQANMTGNYSVLRDMSAPGFQGANSFAELSTIFAELRARQIDFGPVAVIDPQLYRAPAIDQTGKLRLTGFFPSQPERVNFDLAFQIVEGQWRLFGIGLNTSREVAAGPGAAPSSLDPANAGGGGADAPNGPASPLATPPLPRLRPQS